MFENEENTQIKRCTDFLYYSHKVRSGGTQKMMWPLGRKCSKKFAPMIKLVETSLICARIGLTGIF